MTVLWFALPLEGSNFYQVSPTLRLLAELYGRDDLQEIDPFNDLPAKMPLGATHFFLTPRHPTGIQITALSLVGLIAVEEPAAS